MASIAPALPVAHPFEGEQSEREDHTMSVTSEPEITDSTPAPQLREAYNRASERAQANAEAANRVPHLERENALLRAGGDPDSRVGRLLLSDDEVDWSDRAAVTAAWTEVAPATTEPPPPPAERETPDQEAINRQQRLDALATGAVPPGEEPTDHPMDEAYRIFWDRRGKGRDRERAGAAALDHILEAAVGGDKRVLYDPKIPYSEQMER